MAPRSRRPEARAEVEQRALTGLRGRQTAEDFDVQNNELRNDRHLTVPNEKVSYEIEQDRRTGKSSAGNLSKAS